MKEGRPTKYDPNFIEELEYYISMCGRENAKLPTVEGFARHIHVNTDTIVEWCKIYPEFSVAIKGLKEVQKDQLMDDGMYGGKEVNATMAIFLLKANHGLIETSRQELTGKDGKDLPAPIFGGKSASNEEETTK